MAVSVDGGAPIDLVAGAGKESAGVVSNDNKWLAFDTWESGVPEVYVMPFAPGWEAERGAGRPVPDFSERFRISIAGGAKPVWGSTGQKLFYASPSNSVIGVRWSTDGTRFTYDAGQPYFDFPQEASAYFDVLPTDESFIVNATLAARDDKLRLVLNWTSLLER
jgi:Tol biopolymer transport system component